MIAKACEIPCNNGEIVIITMHGAGPRVYHVAGGELYVYGMVVLNGMVQCSKL